MPETHFWFVVSPGQGQQHLRLISSQSPAIQTFLTTNQTGSFLSMKALDEIYYSKRACSLSQSFGAFKTTKRTTDLFQMFLWVRVGADNTGVKSEPCLLSVPMQFREVKTLSTDNRVCRKNKKKEYWALGKEMQLLHHGAFDSASVRLLLAVEQSPAKNRAAAIKASDLLFSGPLCTF